MKNDKVIAFAMMRVAIGVSLCTTGAVRFPKMSGFSAWMVDSFGKTILPKALLVPFSYALPIAEFSVGLLLVLGLFTRGALIGGGIIMASLLFGTALTENWESIPGQLLHTGIFAVLLAMLAEYNGYSLDKLRKA